MRSHTLHTFWDTQVPGHAGTRHGHTCTHTRGNTFRDVQVSATGTRECRGGSTHTLTPDHTLTPERTRAHARTRAHVHSHPRACTYSRRGRAPGPAGAANGEPLPVTWADTRGARRSLWFRRARRAPPGGREECVRRGRWVAPGRGQGSPQDWHRQDLGVPSPFKRAWKTEKVLVLARG